MSPTTSSSSSPRPAPHHRLWSALVRHAQDHHASVHAAYTAYYGPGAAPGRGAMPSSLSSSCSSSAEAVVERRRMSSSSSSTYLSSSSPSLYSAPCGKKMASVPEATAAAAAASTPRHYAGRAWRAVKRHAREHHESVQASYVALHGR